MARPNGEHAAPRMRLRLRRVGHTSRLLLVDAATTRSGVPAAAARHPDHLFHLRHAGGGDGHADDGPGGRRPGVLGAHAGAEGAPTAAIRQRQAAEPRVARNQIQMMTGDADLVSMRAELIQEPGFKEFNRLDDQVERQLLALLGPELMKELPRRPGSLNKDGKGKNEGKGKGEGKGNAKGGGKAGGKGGQGGRAGGGKGRGGGGYSK